MPDDTSESAAGDYANILYLLKGGSSVDLRSQRFAYHQCHAMANLANEKGGHLTLLAAGFTEPQLQALSQTGKGNVTFVFE